MLLNIEKDVIVCRVMIQTKSEQLLGTGDTNGDSNDDDVDDGEVQYRVGIVADVDLGVVSKTLVAWGLISYASGTLR